MSRTHSALNLLLKKYLSVFFPPFHLHNIFCNSCLLIYIQLLLLFVTCVLLTLLSLSPLISILNQIVFFQLHFSFCTGELCIFGAPLMIFKQLLVTIYIFVFKYFLFVYLAQNSTQGWETGIFFKATYLSKHCITSLDLLLLSYKSAASWGSVNLLPASHFCHHFTHPDKVKDGFCSFWI